MPSPEFCCMDVLLLLFIFFLKSKLQSWKNNHILPCKISDLYTLQQNLFCYLRFERYVLWIKICTLMFRVILAEIYLKLRILDVLSFVKNLISTLAIWKAYNSKRKINRMRYAVILFGVSSLSRRSLLVSLY